MLLVSLVPANMPVYNCQWLVWARFSYNIQIPNLIRISQNQNINGQITTYAQHHEILNIVAADERPTRQWDKTSV